MEVRKLCQLQIQRLLLIMGSIAAIAVLVQLLELPYQNYTLILSHNNGTTMMTVDNNTLNKSTLIETKTIHEIANNSDSLELLKKDGYKSGAEGDNKDYDFASNDYGVMENDGNTHSNITFETGLIIDEDVTLGNFTNKDNSSSPLKVVILSKNEEIEQAVKVSSSNMSIVVGTSITKRRGKKPTTISAMNLLLDQASGLANSMRAKWSSARDRELQQARIQIENAPIIRDTRGLYASAFRNVSMFKRSYELMERVLKVYIYSEGEKPIFHQPMLRGIYASEGWFMKLMEGNKKFVVKDPKKAHLFYLPFSSQKLRSALHGPNFTTQSDLEKYLHHYVRIIASRYPYWNRTSGADHFLVACHDWAPKFTRKNMGNTIKTLCNSNVARYFKIGKDISLPVTYIRSSRNPVQDLGGNAPSERPVLAFFAGSMHGNLRPVLLKYWNDKVPDMKIFGPMPRDIEGKTKYRQLMKSSKYCICAKGYEVHTPRVVESIYYECVPVIISDNYVPPLFGILNWEAFSVFVLEEDVPNLRDILLSIPEEKYLAMQRRVKMVQRHFVWHKEPVKYDLFHMILHSIWYQRVFQLKPG